MSYDNIWGVADNVGASRKPGVYLGEVALAERKMTDENKPYINLRFVEPGTDKVLCFDKLFLAGKETALSLTKARMKALGFTEGSSPEMDDFNGRRVNLILKNGKPNQDGKVFLEIDVFNKDCFGGYKPVATAAAKPADDDTPF